MRVRLLHAVVTVAAATVAACGDGGPGPTSPREIWDQKAIQNYDFVYEAGSLCGVTRVRVEVRDGVVTNSIVLDEGCIAADATSLTVEGVFEKLAEAQRSADDVQVTYDPTYGFPTRVGVDAIQEAIDDEYGFGIEEFAVVESGPVDGP